VSRAPGSPSSVNGERPAVNRIGTFSRAALNTPHNALAVPTLTCTMTAGTLPEAAA
jgi:hypothetical protein